MGGGILPYDSRALEEMFSDVGPIVSANAGTIIYATNEFCEKLRGAVHIVADALDVVRGRPKFPTDEYIWASGFFSGGSIDAPRLLQFIGIVTGERLEAMPNDEKGLEELMGKLYDGSVLPLSVYYDAERYFDLETEMRKARELAKRLRPDYDRALEILAGKQRTGQVISEAEEADFQRMRMQVHHPKEDKFMELVFFFEGAVSENRRYDMFPLLGAPEPESGNVLSLSPTLLETLVTGELPESVREAAARYGAKLPPGGEGLRDQIERLRGNFGEYLPALEVFAKAPSVDTLLAAASAKTELAENLQFMRSLTDPSGEFWRVLIGMGEILSGLKADEEKRQEQLPEGE
jgi:hypothetical protein